MNRANELLMLRQQKKEIEERIKELQDEEMVICDNVKFQRTPVKVWERDNPPYVLSFRYKDEDFEDSKPRWYKLIRKDEKEEAVNEIRRLIENLQELLKGIEKNGTEN